MSDGHEWRQLGKLERSELARVLRETASEFDSRPLAERVTLRTVRLAMSAKRLGLDLWCDVTSVLWVSPNQVGLVVSDPDRFYERARSATMRDGTKTFRSDPFWLLRLFKHGSAWSLRERDAREWGVQLYRRGRSRSVDGEVVVDVDRVTLSAGAFAHIRDVLRTPADPSDAWKSMHRKK